MTKEIPLTRGMVALVDDEDYERVRNIKWYPNKSGSRKITYAINPNTRPTSTMHRIILGVGAGQYVDHIDGNGLNNVKANLRVCTLSQNQRNRTAPKNNKTGYKGVTTNKRDYPGKYIAKIRRHSQRIEIGIFDTPELAARAYDAKARELFGEFARCNFPEDK